MSSDVPSQLVTQCPTFTTDPSLTAFQVHPETYLSTLPNDIPCSPSDITPRFIAVGALTFDSHSRILLIQRASTDSMPHLWEIPGGGCDQDDPTVLHSVARELEEETGLRAVSVGPLVGGGYVFATRSGKVVCKYNFLVETDREAEGKEHWVKVRLDPNEHQNHVWATEEEVRAGCVGKVDVKFTTAEQRQVILDAFQMKRNVVRESAAGVEGGAQTA